MIAVMIDNLANLKDWVVWTNIAHALQNTDRQGTGGANQEIVPIGDLSFRQLPEGEALFIAAHGTPGILLGLGGGTPAVQLDEGDVSIGEFLGNAITDFKNGPTPTALGKALPNQVIVLACEGGQDSQYCPSIVQGVAREFTKQAVSDVRVKGFHGKSISAPGIGPTRVCRPERHDILSEVESELKAKYKVEENTREIIQSIDLSPQQKAFAVAKATADFYKEFVKVLDEKKVLYPSGEGIIRDNSIHYELAVAQIAPTETEKLVESSGDNK